MEESSESKSLDLSQLTVSTRLPVGLDAVIAASGRQLYLTQEHETRDGVLTTRQAVTTASAAVVQDLTYGLAGKVWDAAYLTALYLSVPMMEATSATRPRITLVPPPSPVPLFAPVPPQGLAKAAVEVDRRQHSWKLLELGSGTGYLGLHVAQQLAMAAQLNPYDAPTADITLTDLREAQPLLQKNIWLAANHDLPATANNNNNNNTDAVLLGDRVSVRTRPLHWGSTSDADSLKSELLPDQSEWDLVIGSDLVYFPELYEPLIKTLCQVCSMRTTLVLGWRCRQLWRESPFWEQFGLYFTFEAVRVQSIPKPVSNNENDSDNSDNRNTNENSDNTNDNNDNEEYFLGEEQDAWVFVAHKRPINTDEPFNSELKYRVDDQLARLLLARIRI